jgi:hypothetical protein
VSANERVRKIGREKSDFRTQRSKRFHWASLSILAKRKILLFTAGVRS